MAEKAMRKPKSESQKRMPSFTEDDDDGEESASSPLRFHSPLRSDEPETAAATALAISPVAKPIVPLRSKRRRHFAPYPSQRTIRPSLPPSPLSRHSNPPRAAAEGFNAGEEEDVETPVTLEKSDSPLQVAVVVREESAEEGRRRSVGAILRRSRKAEAVERAALGIRVCEVAMCVVSFAVMATNKTQGWSGDSFDRYKEYRYCLCVAIIAFVYSGFQAMDLACSLATGRHLIQHVLRYHFDFCMDQILAYLLISASSSAATRVNDWESNWGKDEVTQKATASVSTAFLAFIFFAVSSVISGYNTVVVRNSNS
uniref:CASP-like protein n=1 Tax=Kalanchoe fedtschenkoi TaxID=63787 RepID=A0A7N0T5Q0_KALFE